MTDVTVVTVDTVVTVVTVEILNFKGHQNCIFSSKVTLTLPNWSIEPIGGVASGRVCVCSLRSRLVLCQITKENSR